jgi:hypothetical protein
MIIDFFSLTGTWVDSCDAAQVAMLLPILRTLYGDVTMVERGAAVDVVADDFGAWLMSV